MAGHFHRAPFARDAAFGVDDEAAALDAAHLLAVHVFHLDHLELRAERFVRIRDERKWETKLRAKVIVRLHAVARDADHNGVGFFEVRM